MEQKPVHIVSSLEDSFYNLSTAPLINVKAIKGEAIINRFLRKMIDGMNHLIELKVISSGGNSGYELATNVLNYHFNICEFRNRMRNEPHLYKGDKKVIWLTDLLDVTFPIIQTEMHKGYHVSTLHTGSVKTDHIDARTLMIVTGFINKIVFAYYTLVFRLNKGINTQYNTPEAYLGLKSLISQKEYDLTHVNQSAELATYFMIIAFLDNFARKNEETHEHLCSFITFAPLAVEVRTRSMRNVKTNVSYDIINTVKLTNYRFFINRVTLLFLLSASKIYDKKFSAFNVMFDLICWMKNKSVQEKGLRVCSPSIHLKYWNESNDRLIELFLWRILIINALSTTLSYTEESLNPLFLDFMCRVYSDNFTITSNLPQLQGLVFGKKNKDFIKFKMVYLYLQTDPQTVITNTVASCISINNMLPELTDIINSLDCQPKPVNENNMVSINYFTFRADVNGDEPESSQLTIEQMRAEFTRSVETDNLDNPLINDKL